MFIVESEFKPGMGPPRIASPAFSTSTVFANDMCGLITKDQETFTRSPPQAEDQSWAQQLQLDTDVAFSSMVAAAAQDISQRDSFTVTGNETLEPHKEAMEREIEVRATSRLTPVLAGLEISNPLPKRQDLTTQEFLSHWSAAQRLESPGDQNGIRSPRPSGPLLKELAKSLPEQERASSAP